MSEKQGDDFCGILLPLAYIILSKKYIILLNN